VSHYDKETGLLKISWSKVRLAEECRQKAYLVSEGKKSAAANQRIFFPGNVVDQAMRKWLLMERRPKFWMAEHVDDIMDELEHKISQDDSGVLKWRNRADRNEVRQFVHECAMRLELLLDQFVTPYENYPALRFSTKLVISGLDGEPMPILLNGEMDVLTKKDFPPPDITSEPGIVLPHQLRHPELRVWDLKGTKDASYWRKTTAQLVFYDIACICLFGQPTVEVGLLQPMVDSQPWMSFRPSDEDRTQMFTRIESVAQGILRQDYTPKADSAGCDWCECRNACVKYATTPGTKSVPLF
jgi:hypothetical protein